MMESKAGCRLEYIDFCKVFAIFLVTFAHCAQQLCGEKFPVLLVSKDSFISVNMAVFMIASGMVMNVDKMRCVPVAGYLWSKTLRLLLPMAVWYLVMCVVTLSPPRLPVFWSLYWYLGALFVCLSLVRLLAGVFRSNVAVAILSIAILTAIPMISFERSCYMMPFLWLGYCLRSFVGKVRGVLLVALLLAYLVLYCFWDIEYSIYVTPFHIWNVDVHSLFSLFFRFAIGATGGVAVIALARWLISERRVSWMRRLSEYGRYTLVFYTMSFVLNAILARILWHTGCYVTTPGLLDAATLLVTSAMMILMYFVQKLLRHYGVLRLLFLGEK